MTFSLIEKYSLIIGSFIAAVLVLMFCWNFVQYVFFGGDDAHRNHAKVALLNLSITLALFLVLWGIAGWLAGYLPA